MATVTGSIHAPSLPSRFGFIYICFLARVSVCVSGINLRVFRRRRVQRQRRSRFGKLTTLPETKLCKETVQCCVHKRGEGGREAGRKEPIFRIFSGQVGGMTTQPIILSTLTTAGVCSASNHWAL